MVYPGNKTLRGITLSMVMFIMLLSMCTGRLQTENKLLRAEADSLSQQNRQQQQGLSQVEELATMLQESHRLLYGHNLLFLKS